MEQVILVIDEYILKWALCYFRGIDFELCVEFLVGCITLVLLLC